MAGHSYSQDGVISTRLLPNQRSEFTDTILLSILLFTA